MKQNSQILDRLSAIEESFQYRAAAPDDGAWFEIVRGSLPVLVSAPHACMHERDGTAKMEEEYTGALACYLADVCGCYALVTRSRTFEDPNWQTDSLYKQAIKQLQLETGIRFLIDLHGMTNRYHMGVAIGTIKGKSCGAADVLPHFTEAGFQHVVTEDLTPDSESAWRRAVVDHPKFTGGVMNHTVTRFSALELGVPSVQIELSSEVRVVESAATDDWPRTYHGNPEAITATVAALSSLVASFA